MLRLFKTSAEDTEELMIRDTPWSRLEWLIESTTYIVVAPMLVL